MISDEKSARCVSAEFRIEDILPPNLAQGVFVPGKRDPAWIRFSNGDANAHRAGAKGDVRGMAISGRGDVEAPFLLR
jgi:catalase